MLLATKRYVGDFSLLLAIASLLILLTCLTIWAIFDISNRASLSREKKSEFTRIILWVPIFGVLYYLISIRPTLND